MIRGCIVGVWLLFVGCSYLPSEARMPDSDEVGYISDVVSAMHEAGRDVRLPVNSIRIYDEPGAVDAECYDGILSGAPTGTRYACAKWLNGVGMVVLETDNDVVRESLIRHEMLHILRGLWVVQAHTAEEYTRRASTGSGVIGNIMDPGHLDKELWEL